MGHGKDRPVPATVDEPGSGALPTVSCTHRSGTNTNQTPGPPVVPTRPCSSARGPRPAAPGRHRPGLVGPA